MKIIGFTGTSEGMTDAQKIQVHMLLGDLKTAGAERAIHGMCIGADDQFNTLARALGYFTYGFPGVTKTGIAWKRADCEVNAVKAEQPFLERNRGIVQVAEVMIATPKQVLEQHIGSGTWATIRYARQAEKPLAIVWPDGTGIVGNPKPGVPWLTLDEYRAMLSRSGAGQSDPPAPL